ASHRLVPGAEYQRVHDSASFLLICPARRAGPGRCSGRESNPHVSRRRPLEAVRLPIPSPEQAGDAGGGIRTLTVWFLRPVPLPSWATPAVVFHVKRSSNCESAPRESDPARSVCETDITTR